MHSITYHRDVQVLHEIDGVPTVEETAKSQVVNEQTDSMPGHGGHELDTRQHLASAEQEARHSQPVRPSDMHRGGHDGLPSAKVCGHCFQHPPGLVNAATLQGFHEHSLSKDVRSVIEIADVYRKLRVQFWYRYAKPPLSASPL